MKQEEHTFKQLSPDVAINIALDAHAKGHTDEAARLYEWLLAATPEYPEALHFCGLLKHQNSEGDVAVRMIKRAIELAPQQLEWNNTLGSVLFQQDKFADAANAFAKITTANPDNALAWNNLGVALQKAAQYSEAENAYQKAISLNPIFEEALNNFAVMLDLLGKPQEAAEYSCRALVANPKPETPKKLLAVSYYRLGRLAEAAAVYSAWLDEEPDNPIPKHMLAACSGQNIPSHAALDFITKTFDESAETFEQKLVETLQYKAPQFIGKILANLAPPKRQWHCLDAGCGTGLCGHWLRPYAAQLVGIDLSTKMLEKAQEKGMYDQLIHGDIENYLQSRQYNFQLVVCADTLIYIGELATILKNIYESLDKNGYFIFTLEQSAHANGTYQINASGRYSHSQMYIHSMLKSNNFAINHEESFVIRVEFGQPIQGLLIVAQKA